MPISSPLKIGTSIKPQGVFPQQFSRQAGNLAAALALPGRADLMHASNMKGVSSISPMLQWNRGTQYGGALAQALAAPPQIATQHALANQQRILQQQGAREQEAMGWAGLGLQNQAMRLQQQGGLLNMLRTVYRPLG